MTDQERKDLAQAYQLMMQSAAWKHFDAVVLGPIADKATKDEDAIDIMNLDRSVGLLGECRGRRNAIRKIKSELAYIVDGLN